MFKSGKNGYVKKNCHENNLNDKCQSCEFHGLTACWENPENATIYPVGFKPKLTVGEVKKKITKAIKTQQKFMESMLKCMNSHALM